MATIEDYKTVHDALRKMNEDPLYESTVDERTAMKVVLKEQEERANSGMAPPSLN